MLESARRAHRAEIPQGIYYDWYGVIVYRCYPMNAGDKRRVLESAADANGIGFARKPEAAYIDIVIACAEELSGEIA
jgi:hypothetical protein